jgi:putative transposase
VPTGLERRYGLGQLHFITFSCRQRKPYLKTAQARNLFLHILNDVRADCKFVLVGCVVMPEHVHLLIGEPIGETPSFAIKLLKQRSARLIRATENRAIEGRFWESRFYDFNVWSLRKRGEKLNYMHKNPAIRGLVAEPELWMWSSDRFYRYREKGICAPDLILE